MIDLVYIWDLGCYRVAFEQATGSVQGSKCHFWPLFELWGLILQDANSEGFVWGPMVKIQSEIEPDIYN